MAEVRVDQEPREPSRERLLATLKWLMTLPDPPAQSPALTERSQDR